MRTKFICLLLSLLFGYQHLSAQNLIPVPKEIKYLSDKVVRIIQSYVGVVNKMVWRKS